MSLGWESLAPQHPRAEVVSLKARVSRGEAGVHRGVEGWRGKSSSGRKSSLSYSSSGCCFFTVSCDTHVEAGLEVVLSIEGFGGEWKVLSCICRLCWLVRPGQYYICSLVLVLSYGAESIMYLRDVY